MVVLDRAAQGLSRWAGSPWGIGTAAGLVLAWAATGPFLGFSERWQMLINTATTIITFLMVFLLQRTQNHDTRALHVKLDELIRAVAEARNEFRGIEERPEADVAQLGSEART